MKPIIKKYDRTALRTYQPEDLILAYRRLRPEIHERVNAHRIPMALRSLDELTGGFKTGGLTVVGARTSGGKSAFMLQNALTLSVSGLNVIFITLEDSTINTAERSLCNLFGLKNYELKRGIFDGDSAQIEADLSRHSLFFLDTIGFNMAEIDHIFEKTIFNNGKRADVVFLDYIGRVDEFGMGYEHVTGFMNDLSFWVKTKGLVFIMGGQINRAGVGEAGSHNLKGSGAIEEMADAIIILEYPFQLGVTDSWKPEKADFDDIRALISENRELTEEAILYKMNRIYFLISIAKGKDTRVRHHMPFEFWGEHYRFQEWRCPYAVYKGGCVMHAIDFPEITNEHENEKEGGV